MPAIEITAMPKVAGMARSYVPADTTRQWHHGDGHPVSLQLPPFIIPQPW